MAAKHSLRIRYDQDTESLSIQHFTSTQVGDHVVSSSEEIFLQNPQEWIDSFNKLISLNQDEMERISSGNAIVHAAALEGKVLNSRQKLLKLGGSIGMSGKASIDSNDTQDNKE